MSEARPETAIHRPPSVRTRFERCPLGDAGISTITARERARSVAKSGSTQNRAALETFLLPLLNEPLAPYLSAP